MSSEQNNILDDKLKWILSVTERIMQHYQSRTKNLSKFILNILRKYNGAIAYNNIACDGNVFMIISDNPKQLIANVMTELKNANNEEYQNTLNPVSVITKLSDNEFMVDMNGTHMLYFIKASVHSNNLLKSIACKCVADVKKFYSNTENYMFKNIDELHPDFNYTEQTIAAIRGGKKQKQNKQKQNKRKDKFNLRIDILTKLKQFVNNDENISKGIIFVNDINECKSTAMNIIFTDRQYKDAIVEYMNLYFGNNPKYKFKAFRHNDFYVPYNFKIIKHSCLVNDNNASQVIYIANLYNIATYSPVPCYHSSFEKNINIAHPIIKLQLLYIDLFMIEHKTKTVDVGKSVYGNKLLTTFEEVKSFNTPVIWVGYYMDDAHARNRHNMMSKINNNNETYFV